jgi:Mn2+/Fe2+ NRAMP family transporter
VELIFTKKENKIRTKFRTFYVIFLIILSCGAFVIISQFQDDLKELVDFATVLSFVIAPVIAIFNFRLVTGKFLDKEHQPSILLKILSVSGIVFLSGFAIFFIMTKFYS